VGIQAYSYTDLFVPETRIYYKVRFVFTDGSSLYTNTESIDFVKAQDSLLRVYPNPAQNRVNFEFSNIIGQLRLELINMEGKIVLSQVWSERESLSQEINIRQLPPGLYYYRLRFSGETRLGKLIKLK